MSKYFGDVATGFHLKEYTNKELYSCNRSIKILTKLKKRVTLFSEVLGFRNCSIGNAPAELSIRGWALIQNVAHYNPRTVKKLNGCQSPAERLNQFKYHDNWLHNLLISASLEGCRSPPQNPI